MFINLTLNLMEYILLKVLCYSATRYVDKRACGSPSSRRLLRAEYKRRGDYGKNPKRAEGELPACPSFCLGDCSHCVNG